MLYASVFCKLFLIAIAIAEPVILGRSHMPIRTLCFIGLDGSAMKLNRQRYPDNTSSQP